ncbi:ChaN family lipoprotein [Pseudoalteromonas luteoviolacea]|uniref:Haem-binding uptake Tiki superfamily ChaN domain-containing protein n=1 Tax=Pseudoalteromonas luteoviolacea DSM 6061 TaxID=1365250 RepID=A0A166VNI7_9GAMM|nr:ChaN family lipoprotein [Pseudoalteromonas luteoviolacea]KZN33216.1 hypothetical protein N475_03755 [Pseudoalteromonas luteoviolacea DSM 6061]MBE0385925.1 hypothetical protein [Pseudoalteromonas luteoviolacea DSM 6061]
MKFITTLAAIASIVSMQGCSITEQSEQQGIEISTMYDYVLHDSKSKLPTSIEQISENLKDIDVIFIGEYHSHSASHKLQADLLTALYLRNKRLVLTMEQFSRDKQQVLDQYLDNEIGEQTLINEGDAWENYRSDYRPLIEFAKSNQLPVFAANTPLSIVRCVARKGPEFIKTLDSEKELWVATDITTSTSAYQDKFTSAMMHHKTNKSPNSKVTLNNSFYAQLARDNTMAESIYNAHVKYPKSQIVHFNGAFHSNHYLGTVDALTRIAPNLNIAIISPNFLDEEVDWTKGDYIYKLKPLPARYIKNENKEKSIVKMINSRSKRKCEL